MSQTMPLLSQAEAVAFLKQQQISPTLQRLAIARIFFVKHQHLSADVIQEKLAELNIRVAKATVYNSLNLFVRKGLLKEIHIGEGKVVYDSNTAPHYHLYYEDEKRLCDVDYQELPIKIPAHTQLKQIDLILRVTRA